PWPTAPNGTGPSLQLMDAAQDNTRVSNWSDGIGFVNKTFTGLLGGTKLYLFLDAPGSVNIDRISIVAGSVAESGSNYVQNGSFETAFTGPWHTLGAHSNSTISASVKFDGTGSLQITNAFGIGGVNNCVYQDLAGVI